MLPDGMVLTRYKDLQRPTDDIVSQMNRYRLGFGLMFPSWRDAHDRGAPILSLTVVATINEGTEVIAWGIRLAHPGKEVPYECQLYTRPEYRRQGVGRELMGALMPVNDIYKIWPDRENNGFFESLPPDGNRHRDLSHWW